MTSAKSQFAFSIENDAIKILRTASATHGDPSLRIQFICTLRVPDGAAATTLPPGLGRYTLSKISDHKRGLRSAGVAVDRGVFFPMHRECSRAKQPHPPSPPLYVSFSVPSLALTKIILYRRRVHVNFLPSQRPIPGQGLCRGGGLNAVSGEYRIEDADTKARRREHCSEPSLVQDYIVLARQLFLDGVAVSPGVFRQFEALPSGQEYGADVRMTKESFVSDLQLEITPHGPFLRAPPPFGYTRREMLTDRAGKHKVVIFFGKPDRVFHILQYTGYGDGSQGSHKSHGRAQI